MDSKNCRDKFHEVWTGIGIEEVHGLRKNLLKRKRSDNRTSDEENDDEVHAVQVTPTTVVLEGGDGYASNCDMD